MPLSSGAVYSNNGLISSGAQLAITRGGTNSTSVPTAGGIAYGDGTAYQFTGAGTSGHLLQSNAAGAPTWVSASAVNYWQRALGVLSPLEVTNDLIVGGSATGSALFRAEGLTGNLYTSGSASISGTITLGYGSVVRPAVRTFNQKLAARESRMINGRIRVSELRD